MYVEAKKLKVLGFWVRYLIVQAGSKLLSRSPLHSGVDIGHVVGRRLLVACVSAAGAGQSARRRAPRHAYQHRAGAYVLEQTDSFPVRQPRCAATVHRQYLVA